MPRDIAVTLLNWNRRDLLEHTLLSFLKHHWAEAYGFYWIVLDNGSFDSSRDFLDRFSFWDRKIYLEENVGNGEGTSLLMQAFLESPCDYVLHLENDWKCLRSGFSRACVELMAENPDVGCVRLSNKDYRNFNEVDGRPLEWSGPLRYGRDAFMVADCHYTFNPMIASRDAVEQVFPCKSERMAQNGYYKLGLKTAQIQEPKCFEHIGTVPKQSFRDNGVLHRWTK